MTDWHMVVETFPNGRHNFPKVMPERKRPAGPEPLHHDGPLGPCGTRPVHLPGSRHAVEHRRPQPRRDAVQERRQQRLSRQRVVLERHHQHPELRALQRVHAFALQARQRQGDLRSHRPDQRGCGLGHRWRGRSGALAGADLPHQVAHRLPDAEEHLLPPRSLQRLRSGGLPGNVPSLQGGPRAEGHLHQSAGRRERLALPEPARRRALAARQARDHGFDERAVRRHCPLRLPDGADRQERCADDRDLGRAVSRRRSLAADRLSRDARPASRRPRDRYQPPRLAARRVGGEAGRRRRGHHAAAWRRDHDAGDARGAAAG